MRSSRVLRSLPAGLAIAGFVAFFFGCTPEASARSLFYRDEPYGRFDLASTAVAIVALKEQHITIYDANGKVVQAPVSSGQTGLETPAGIYSIVQKEEEHYSNRYDDASMPFMERITWTGIALHAGVLPGYPASHGCVRMPEDFAEQLYQVTQLGMRVIVVRDDMTPAEIAQPPLFNTSHEMRLRQLRSIADDKASESETATRREKELKVAAAKASTAVPAAERAQREAEGSLARAEAQLASLERTAGPVAPATQNIDIDAAKAKAQASVETAKAQLETAKLQLQAKVDAVKKLQEDLKAASITLNIALDASEAARQNLSPVSVFISRKMLRLYIRKGNQPVFEGPVTIRDADKPLGTFVFTALDYTGTPGQMRWNVVSMYKDATHPEPYVKETASKAKTSGGPGTSDVNGAAAALGRLVVPDEAVARISEAVLPGSSLIISDEALSNETGKDTDFIVVMSGEPQGGLTIRRHERPNRQWQDDSFAFWGSSGGRRQSGGGGFPFFFSD
ncbi:MAG: L,D-transpeptidase family protein [Rhodomicrobium sp.]